MVRSSFLRASLTSYLGGAEFNGFLPLNNLLCVTNDYFCDGFCGHCVDHSVADRALCVFQHLSAERCGDSMLYSMLTIPFAHRK